MKDGALHPGCDCSPHVPGEEPAVYFFWGHVFPQSEAQAVLLVKFTEEHFDCAKATPFDTGSVLRTHQNTPPRFGYGRHVIKCTLSKMPDERGKCVCSAPAMHVCTQKRIELVNGHSTSGYENIRQYFSYYLGVYYKNMLAYVKGKAECAIDGYQTKAGQVELGEKNACAFEVRCLNPVPLMGQKWILTEASAGLLESIGYNPAGADVSIVDNPEGAAWEHLEEVSRRVKSS